MFHVEVYGQSVTRERMYLRNVSKFKNNITVCHCELNEKAQCADKDRISYVEATSVVLVFQN